MSGRRRRSPAATARKRRSHKALTPGSRRSGGAARASLAQHQNPAAPRHEAAAAQRAARAPASRPARCAAGRAARGAADSAHRRPRSRPGRARARRARRSADDRRRLDQREPRRMQAHGARQQRRQARARARCAARHARRAASIAVVDAMRCRAPRARGRARRPGCGCSGRADTAAARRRAARRAALGARRAAAAPAGNRASSRTAAMPASPSTGAAGAAADQMGLGLVLAMMRGQQMQAALGRAPLGEQPVARRARRFLDAGRRLGAVPDQDRMGDAAGREPAGRPSPPRRRSPAASRDRRSAPMARAAALRAPSDRRGSPAPGCRGRRRPRRRSSGRGSNPPIAASAAANSCQASAAAAVLLSSQDACSRQLACSLIAALVLGKLLIELSERDAGILLLVGAGQRHAELQQIVGRLGAFRDSACSPRRRPPPRPCICCARR